MRQPSERWWRSSVANPAATIQTQYLSLKQAARLIRLALGGIVMQLGPCKATQKGNDCYIAKVIGFLALAMSHLRNSVGNAALRPFVQRLQTEQTLPE